MASKQFSDFAQTTLSAGCTNVATTLSVVSVAGWATVGDFWLRIDDPSPATTFEWVKVTSVNVAGNQVTVVRGENGTTGIAHGAGAFVSNKIPAIALAWGLLAPVAQITAISAGFTTVADITGLSSAVTVAANRIIRVSTTLRVSSTVAGDYIDVSIQEGATILTSGEMGIGATAGRAPSLTVTGYLTPSAGAHTYKVTAVRQTGTGTGTIFAATTDPAVFSVEDLGPV